MFQVSTAYNDVREQGSLCLRDEYLRLALISYGWNNYDYGLTVTTPGSSIQNLCSIGAHGGYDPRQIMSLRMIHSQ